MALKTCSATWAYVVMANSQLSSILHDYRTCLSKFIRSGCVVTHPGPLALVRQTPAAHPTSGNALPAPTPCARHGRRTPPAPHRSPSGTGRQTPGEETAALLLSPPCSSPSCV